MKQAPALGLKTAIITTGGSQSPDQLIEQAGKAAERHHGIWCSSRRGSRNVAESSASQAFIDEWNKRGYPFAGLTEELPRL